MYQLRVRDVGIGALAVVASSVIGSAAQAQPMTWVDTQFSYDYGFTGGLPIDGVTSNSRHFDTNANPVVDDRSYSYTTIGGVIAGSCDASFFDPAPFDSNQYGFNLNTSVNYSGLQQGSGDPDPSTRTLWLSAIHNHVFRVTAPMEALGIEFGGEGQPWSLAVLESGVWDGSVFTSSAPVFDFLSAPPTPTLLEPGDYRVRAELAYSWEVTGPYYVGSIFNWIVRPAVPAPGTAALLGLGGVAALRRRQVAPLP